MKAAVTVGKRSLQITDLPMPVAGHGEAVLKVKYTGICGTDTHIYTGTFPLLNYPIVPGHEFVGQLVEINGGQPEVDKFLLGDWFVAQPFFSCYVCETCAHGGDNYCNAIKVLGVHVDGSMAEYVKVPAKKLIRVQDDSDKKLVSLTEPLSIGVHSLTKAEFKIGETALIIGGGVIGIMIAIAARIAGASDVVVCEVNDHRLNFTNELGFKTVDTKSTDYLQKLFDITHGLGFDKVFEATGSAFGVRLMTAAAKRGGIIVQVGISTEHHPLHIRSFSDKEIQVRGVRLQTFYDFKTALNIIESGKEKSSFEKIITDIFPFEQAPEAMEFQVTDENHFKVTVENMNF